MLMARSFTKVHQGQMMMVQMQPRAFRRRGEGITGDVAQPEEVAHSEEVAMVRGPVDHVVVGAIVEDPFEDKLRL